MGLQPLRRLTHRNGYRPLTVISLAVPFFLLVMALLAITPQHSAAQTGCSITLQSYQLNYQTERQMLLTVANGSAAPVTITALGLNWAPPPNRLMEISIPAGVRVYTGNNGPPVIANITDTSIAGNSTTTIELRFDDPVATFGSALAVGFQTDQGLCAFIFTPGTTPPSAQPDSTSTDEDSAVIVDVVGNDSDAEGGLAPTSVSVINPPANGTAVPNGDGTVTYTPAADFNGGDSFTYQVCDTVGACDSALVSITVNAVNDPPVAAPDSATTGHAAPVTIDVLSNDSDIDSALDPASVTVISGSGGGTTAADPTTGAITYTPAGGFAGTDTFTYRVCDVEGLCASAPVSVSVAAAPTPVPPTPVPPTPVPPTPVPPTPTGIPTATSAPPPLPGAPPAPTRPVTPTTPASPPAPTDTPPTATPAPAETAAPSMPQDAPPIASSRGLEVSKVASSPEAAPGGIIVFTTTIRNTGTVPLEDVTLLDALSGDAMLTLVTISRGQLNVTAGGIEWLIGGLGPGEVVVIEMQALMNEEAQGIVTNCGLASAEQIDGVTVCRDVTIREEEAAADAGKELPPRPEASIAEPPAPQPALPGLDGIRQIGDRCVVIFGVTVTCIPAMRWLLLIVGLLTLGLGLWVPLWRRFSEEEDDEEIVTP